MLNVSKLGTLTWERYLICLVTVASFGLLCWILPTAIHPRTQCVKSMNSFLSLKSHAVVASDLYHENIHSQRAFFPLVGCSTGRKRGNRFMSRRFKKEKRDMSTTVALYFSWFIYDPTKQPSEHHDSWLSFSAGQWEGEALQAEEDGGWTLLCVEEQSFFYVEAAGGILLQTGWWSVYTSGGTMQEGELKSSDPPTELSNIVSCVGEEWECLSSVAADGGPSNSRLVLQHRGPMGDWP